MSPPPLCHPFACRRGGVTVRGGNLYPHDVAEYSTDLSYGHVYGPQAKENQGILYGILYSCLAHPPIALQVRSRVYEGPSQANSTDRFQITIGESKIKLKLHIYFRVSITGVGGVFIRIRVLVF